MESSLDHEKVIAWRHLQEMYARDSGSAKEHPGLAMVPKLKYEHLNLNSFSKLCLDLVAHVSVYIGEVINVWL